MRKLKNIASSNCAYLRLPVRLGVYPQASFARLTGAFGDSGPSSRPTQGSSICAGLTPIMLTEIERCYSGSFGLAAKKVFNMPQELNIVSRDFKLSPVVEAQIREKVASLDTYYDRISHCDVVVVRRFKSASAEYQMLSAER